MAVCLNHTDTPAVAACAACGKPLCEKCLVDGHYCSKECAANAEKAAVRSHNVFEAKERTDKRKRTLNSIIAIILLIAAGAGAWYYFQHKPELDRKIKREMKQFEQKADNAIKATDKALNRDSRYKRDRQDIVK